MAGISVFYTISHKICAKVQFLIWSPPISPLDTSNFSSRNVSSGNPIANFSSRCHLYATVTSICQVNVSFTFTRFSEISMILSRKSFFGYVVLAIDIVSWAIAAAASQALQRNVPDFQLSALRYISCMVVQLYGSILRNHPQTFSKYTMCTI